MSPWEFTFYFQFYILFKLPQVLTTLKNRIFDKNSAVLITVASGLFCNFLIDYEWLGSLLKQQEFSFPRSEHWLLCQPGFPSPSLSDPQQLSPANAPSGPHEVRLEEASQKASCNARGAGCPLGSRSPRASSPVQCCAGPTGGVVQSLPTQSFSVSEFQGQASASAWIRVLAQWCFVYGQLLVCLFVRRLKSGMIYVTNLMVTLSQVSDVREGTFRCLRGASSGKNLTTKCQMVERGGHALCKTCRTQS